MVKKRRVLVSYKDIQLAFLLEGIKAVERLWATGNVSKATLRRALKKLHDAGENVADLERWVADSIGPVGRGRAAPQKGETRSYKAQQIKDGGPFLRLPLDSLGIQKGRVLRVTFEDDRIVVSL